MQAQVTAYFNLGAFNVPSKQSFVETYLTVVGHSLVKKNVNGQYQNSVNVLLTILKDTSIIKADKYVLKGPLFSDTLNIPTFIDNQRYSLENGTYTIQLVISDNNKSNQKPLKFTQKFILAFNNKEIQSSSIQVLESYKKAQTVSSLTKSGYDLVPYNINYFPETQSELPFYFEAYNLDTVLGKNKPFLFYYYIENSQNFQKQSSFGSFKKQLSSAVNPLLAKIDISILGSGNYNLVLEIKDEQNKIQFQNKYFFQRLNKPVDGAAMKNFNEKKTVSDYFGSCNNIDTLRMFVECLWPIANGVDKERIINQTIKKDPELLKKFAIDFWQRRAADTVSPLKLWARYYRNVQQVMVLFKCGKQKGYYTERGRVYLQYGPPSQRSIQNNELNTFPYEIWQYYSLYDQSNGQKLTNRKFVFVNKMLGDDCHTLVHSDTRGEINNDRWQFEISRRNNNGAANPDQLKPIGSENTADEIYNNPR
jgi:GWxTD domain-containing protein